MMDFLSGYRWMSNDKTLNPFKLRNIEQFSSVVSSKIWSDDAQYVYGGRMLRAPVGSVLQS